MLLDLLSGQISVIAFLFGVVSILLAVTVHEFSHAWVATQLGDPTPKLNGRVTLDPTAHLDQMGTVMLLLFGFGWGKPVPINAAQIKNGRTGVALVSLAGPASNLILATAIGLLFRFGIIPYSQLIAALALVMISINLGLAVFNLLPVGPLDGYKIALGLLPPKLAYRLTQLRAGGQFVWLMLFVVVFFDPIYVFVQNVFFRLVLGI